MNNKFLKDLRAFLIVLPIVYLFSIGYIFFKQRELLYFPSRPLSEAQMQGLKDFQQTQVTTEDGLTITGYYSAPVDKKPVIIIFHGNASHPVWASHKTYQMRQKGYGVLLAGYRGYGGNPGKPTEKGLYRDGKAYLDWVRHKAKDSPVILYGESLGSGVATELAVKYPPVAALILDVPFDSAVLTASRIYPYIPLADLLVLDQYRNNDKIRDVKAPVLFLLAGQDNVVSFQAGLDLYDLANEPKTMEVFEKADHMTIYSYGAENKVMEFLERTFP